MEVETTLGDVDLTTVKARSVSGIVTLISRSFIQRLIGTFGFFALTVFLGRPEIGLFIAVNDLVSILGYFSDIGLAASLIQKKDKVAVIDLRTTFTLQQLIVIFLLFFTLAASPWLFNYYDISNGGIWLFYSLLVAFFLASLKTVPSVILERQLRFEILAAIEVLESLVFYGVAVALAWQGRGVTSYAWAVLLRGLIGTSLIYFLAPWPIGVAFSTSSLRSLLSFGLPYQINSLMAVIKDRFVNIFLWKIIGADGVGIIGWAQNWAQLPLRFVMDNVTKVTFPAYSRLQDHSPELRRAIEKTLFFIAFLTFPLVAGLAVVTPLFVELVPRYSKWQIALLPLTLYCFNSALAAVSTPLTNTLNAIGKVKINTYLMVMWTVLTWLLTPYLALKFGFLGVAYATAAIALTSIIPVIIVHRLTGFSLTRALAVPTVAVLAMLPVSYLPLRVLPHTLTTLVFTICASATIYLLICLLLAGRTLVVDGRKIIYAFRHRQK